MVNRTTVNGQKEKGLPGHTWYHGKSNGFLLIIRKRAVRRICRSSTCVRRGSDHRATTPVCRRDFADGRKGSRSAANVVILERLDEPFWRKSDCYRCPDAQCALEVQSAAMQIHVLFDQG